ncbi:MAG: maltooligosyltrehalose trehalohydrolase [Fusobacteriaceae bacterium]|jgi:maltooligosyltrehalose trehalohydrolase|nr:treZ [Fusobacteriales bacterium]MDN5304906.1 maltooligosyltrehalose trehalohydrolase [Fusobacteriaceae bacterium]
MKLGHSYEGEFSKFIVWANRHNVMKIVFPELDREHDMEKLKGSYFEYKCPKLPEGTKYYFQTADGNMYPDPASKSQPEGVHKYSQIINVNNENKPQNFKGIDLRDAIIYEMHIGTFTKEGTFDAAIKKIPYLKELGINVIEVMPLFSFPGDRNWGYDGVYPYAVDESYGGVKEFIRFINECNKNGIAVILDVVYNHFGPEGNYLGVYGQYFTKRYSTPWGSAISFDGRNSEHVKKYFLDNVKFWLEDVKVDGFRLDAILSIYDFSESHFLDDLYDMVKDTEIKEKRIINVISENPYHTIKSNYRIKLDAHWEEDFHHSIHSYFTGETHTYLREYGSFRKIKEMFENGYCTEFWRNKYFSEPYRLIISIQTHDQIGNRPFGDRLSKLISYEQYKLSAFSMFALPHTPMLFMGEEYFETNPFLFFTSFSDERVIKGVRNGRKKEFEFLDENIPDSQDINTFYSSKLDFDKLIHKKHYEMFEFYKNMIHLKKEKILGYNNRSKVEIYADENTKIIYVKNNYKNSFTIMNFSDKEVDYTLLKDMEVIYSGNRYSETRKTENKIKLQPYGFVLYKF